MFRRWLLIVLLWCGLLCAQPGMAQDLEAICSSQYRVGFYEPVRIVSEDVQGYVISGDGTWVAYRGASDFVLTVVDSGGSFIQTINLPQEAGMVGALESSPDGAWIYFQGWNHTSSDGMGNIWQIQSNGSNLTSIVEVNYTVGIDIPWHITLSPSGTQWVYCSIDSDGVTANYSIYVRDLDWDNPQFLFLDSSFMIQGLDWSPAGIAFWGVRDMIDHSMYLMDVDGSNLRLIVEDQSMYEAFRDPNGSPSGLHFLGFSYGYDAEEFVWVFDNNGANQWPVAMGYNWPQWFPNGMKLAMIGEPVSSSRTPEGLYTLNLPDPITALDSDGDGLTNLEEWATYGTDFKHGDSDRDGVGDGVETKTGFDPTLWDTDGDGTRDGLEFVMNFGEDTTATLLPEGFIQLTLRWSNASMIASSNSTMFSAVFNPITQEFIFVVDGVPGTRGVCNLTLPIEMVPDPSSITVLLDASPILFTYEGVGETVQIYVEYNHSTHQLSVQLTSIITPPQIPGFPPFAIILGLTVAFSIRILIRNRKHK